MDVVPALSCTNRASAGVSDAETLQYCRSRCASAAAGLRLDVSDGISECRMCRRRVASLRHRVAEGDVMVYMLILN